MSLLGKGLSNLQNMYTQLSSGVRGPMFGLNLHLFLYFVYASTKDNEISANISCAGTFYSIEDKTVL